jgi:hypothetical protein
MKTSTPAPHSQTTSNAEREPAWKLAGELGEEEYRGLERAQAEAELLQGRLRGAMQLGDWNQVEALSAAQARTKARLQDTAALRAVAASVYGFEGVLVDPFSPGLRTLAGAPASLPALRDDAIRRFTQLESADPMREELYATRKVAMGGAPVGAEGEAPAGEGATSAQLRAEADRAFASGDFERLQRLSSRILEAQASDVLAGAGPGRRDPVEEHVPDLAFTFPAGVLERVLRDHGAKVVSDAGLDPQRFRLVCIPPDLHLRAGEKRGWGNQSHWTHFDGYMVQDRKFLALALGDVRFGGIHDMVALNRYDGSPSLVVRMAVVQRARMAAW